MAKRIMICDDEADIVDMFSMILESTGATISTEQNSVKLYDRLLTEKPDLLILDIRMPGLTGDDILRHIRSTDSLQDLPVFMVSGEEDGYKRAMDAGATLYFPKPFNIESLLSRVDEQLAG